MILSPEVVRWRRTEEIFHAMLESRPDRREAALEELCGNDAGLILELRTLLAACEAEADASAACRSAALAEPEPSVLRQQRFGPYRAGRLIGRGGMGSVFLGHRADGQFEQKVAIKLIALPLATDFFRERFRQERQILATLDHPNITRLLDGGLTTEGDPYLVMEYVEGYPLNAYCDRLRLSIPRRLALFSQVCSAVGYAHRNLIVHRDLKPANILVTAEGIPKLLDFGTAKLLKEASADTTAELAMLTPRYASPEQLRAEPVTTLSDVYSLGVMLYELVTGAWPFGQPAPGTIGWERALGHAKPLKPAKAVTEPAARARAMAQNRLQRELAGDLGNILLKAIESEPQRRYGSAEELANDLSRLRDGHPVLARSQTVVYRAAKFLRRHWAAVPAAALSVLLLAGAAVYSARQAREARLEAGKATAVTKFLQNTLTSASPGYGGKSDITVVEAMDQARANLSQLSGQPEVETMLHYTIGAVYAGLGSAAKAEEELKRAGEMAQRFGSGEDEAAVDRVLASVEIGRGDWAPAEQHLRRALGYIRKAGPRADPELAHDCVDNLRRVLWFRYGHTPEAESLAREALAIARATPQRQGFFLAVDLASLALYIQEENRLDEAERLLNEALEIQRGLPHPTSAMAATLDAFGTIAARRGDLAAAERYYREERDTTLRVYGLENLNSIAIVAQWGRAWAGLGHGDEAAQETAVAVAAGRRLFPSGSPRLSPVYADYAYVLNSVRRSKEAEVYARQALESLPKDVPATDVRRAAAQLEIGVSLLLQNRFREALPFLEESEHSYTNYPGAGPNARQTLRAREYLEKARAETGKG
jgi:serine/threonine-protein kinase